MRKVLWVVAVGALVLTVAAPAMALDFKFGAEYRIRFYDYANTGFDSANTAGNKNNTGTNSDRGNPRGVQIRVRPRFDASDDNGNITATWRAEFGDTEFGAGGGANGTGFGQAQGSISIAPSGRRVGNNAGGSIGADGVALETKWAYIDFAMPFGLPARVRAGIQPWFLPKGLIIDDDIAGVRAYGKIQPVTYEVFWFRAARGKSTTAIPASGTSGLPGADTTRDNALDYYGGKLDVAVTPWLNPGVYYVYGDNRVQCVNTSGSSTLSPCTVSRLREQHFVGFTTTGKVGIVDYDFDFVYGSTKGGITGDFGNGGTNTGGDINNPITVKGYALDGGVHVPVGPVKVNLLAAYATGDKQDGEDSEAFPLGPGPSWSGAGGQFELIGEGGAFDVITATQAGPTNLWMVGTTLEYVPVKPLWIKMAWGYAGFSNKKGNCSVVVPGSAGCFGPSYSGKTSDPLTAKSGLGHELHLRADYTIWTGFKVQGLVGWLFPRAGDTMGKYILQLYYNF